MNGILYFSSTGNSLYIAERVKEAFGGRLCYIPDYPGDASEFDRVFIVTPIYSFCMPKHVFDLLPLLNKQREIIVIQSYGGMIGGADRLFYEYAQSYTLNIKGIFTVRMPENFTTTFSVPVLYQRLVLKRSVKAVEKIIGRIQRGELTLPPKKRTKKATYLKNMSNWHKIGERFVVSEDCTRCGKCIGLCPSGNISLVDGRITFSDKCVACLGCWHRCPQKAIRYLGKRKRDRYINPNIRESDIGRSF